MTLPVSQLTLNRSIELFAINARNLKLELTEHAAYVAANSASANLLIQIHQECQSFIDSASSVATAPGIDAEIQKQWSAVSSFSTEVNAASIEAQAVVDAVEALIPQDSDGYLLIQKFTGMGVDTRGFSPAQTADLVTAINSFLALLT